MAFHDRIKQARVKAGLTQADIAGLLGIAKSTYSGYETGKSEPSMNTIANMMHFFDVSPGFLWQDEIDAQSKNNHPESLSSKPGAYAQSADEEELLLCYRMLISSAKETILSTVKAFAGNPSMKKDDHNTLAV